jgi:hypothetical protein
MIKWFKKIFRFLGFIKPEPEKRISIPLCRRIYPQITFCDDSLDKEVRS